MKYFMVGGMGGRGGNSDISDWIKEHGTEIPTSEWKTGTDSGSMDNGDTESEAGLGFGFGFGFGFGGQTTLYEVKL